MRIRLRILQRIMQIVCLLVAVPFAGANETLPVAPEPIGFVSDYGRVVAPSYERRLAEIGSELERKTGVRIRVVTLPGLGGADIEAFSKYLLRSWMDSAHAARTILIVDAVADKKMRVTLGEGLGDVITPDLSATVQRQVMLPLLLRGHRGEAYTLAVTELSVAIGMSERVALYSVPGYLKLQPAAYHPNGEEAESFPEILYFVPLLIFMVAMARLENRMARATQVFGAVNLWNPGRWRLKLKGGQD